MEKETLVFDDPLGKFKIQVPRSWKYYQKRGVDEEIYPCQFKIDQYSSFQISCRKINDQISNLIRANNLKFQNFNLPNLSYFETYNPNNKLHAYIWMCPIEDHFILSMYIFDSGKVGKELGLLLMEKRLLLQNLIYKKNDGEYWIANKQVCEKMDIYRIEAWQQSQKRFFEFMSKKDKSKIKRVAPIDIDVIKLYALLRLKISTQPNGFYTLVSVGRPLDNMIWWDFILESNRGFIQIWRTPHIIEAIYEFDEEDFDLKRFFKENIEINIKQILAEIKTFEKHTVYINHYKSYKEIVRSLWGQIKKIDLSVPVGPDQHIVQNDVMRKYHKDVKKFTRNSVKFHTLGKSMLLNAAFLIESFLNLVIRVGGIDEIKAFPEVLERFLRADFMYRMRNLSFHISILSKGVDTNHKAVRDANELMTLRNKYVHFDEDSQHNRIGEVLFDNEFPLHSLSKDRPAIETFKQIFHRPDFNTVKTAYETANQFVVYISSLIRPEVRKEVLHLLEQNPISYNESKGIYSSIFIPFALDFFNVDKKEREPNDGTNQ